MAKGRDERPWAEQLEDAARTGIGSLTNKRPELMAMSELEWCEAVRDGLRAYLANIEGRITELKR